jgi:hypothetical protein
MTKHIKQFIQYMLFGLIAFSTLYISFEIKSFGFTKNWFSNENLGWDGMILWACIMMGLSRLVAFSFRRVFGKENSIL